jgi:hypothetical protein
MMDARVEQSWQIPDKIQKIQPLVVVNYPVAVMSHLSRAERGMLSPTASHITHFQGVLCLLLPVLLLDILSIFYPSIDYVHHKI